MENQVPKNLQNDTQANETSAASVTEEEIIQRLMRRQQERIRKLNQRVSLLFFLTCAVFLVIILLRTL